MDNQSFPWLYQLYGLSLGANRKIPGLVPATTDKPVDVYVELSGQSDSQVASAAKKILLYASAGRTDNGEPFLTVWKQADESDAYVLLRYNNGHGSAVFTINAVGSIVRVSWTKGVPFDDIAAYLLGPVIGCVLRLCGFTCLHAGVIALGNRAIAIIGAKGSGKTTLTAFLASHGHPVLADDMALLREEGGKLWVLPGYPRLRIWPHTLSIFPSLVVDDLPRVLSVLDKRYVNLSLDTAAPRWRFQQQALPLAAIYVLRTRKEGREFSTLPVRPNAGVAILSAHTYPGYFLDQAMRTLDFQVLGRLCASVPLRFVDRPDGLHHLPQLCEIILDEVSG